MRNLLTVALLILGISPALANFTGKDASLNTITFFNPGDCTSVVCVPVTKPVDGTGAAFGVTGNPFFMAFGTGVTLPNFSSPPTVNLGTLNGAATATAQATGNASLASLDGKTPALGQALAAGSVPVVLPAAQITALTPPTSVTANAGTNLNTSALALEAGNLAVIVSQIGPVTASPTANTVLDRLRVLNTTLGTPFQAGGSIGNTSFGISGTLPAFASTPTFNIGTAPTIAVTGTFWQATQPISVASLPLPAGAASAAKQPALGTAGTASSDVLTVQGIASMVPLKVDGSGFTQPISGTITCSNCSGGGGGTSSNFGAAFPTAGTAAGMSQGGNMVALTGTSGNLNVNIAATGVTQPISAASLPLPAGAATATGVAAIVTALGSPFQAGGPIGNTAFGISGTLPAFASTPAFNLSNWNGVALGSPSAYGTSPGAVNVPGVNAFVTNTVPVTGTFWQATQPVSNAGTFPTQVTSLPSIPAGSNSIGAVTTPAAPVTSLTPVPSTSAVASQVLKASAGVLHSAYALNTTSTPGYCLIINATTAPSSGAAVTPLDFAVLPPLGSCQINFAGGPPNAYSTGIVFLVSSNASPYTFTSGTITAAISGRVQ